MYITYRTPNIKKNGISLASSKEIKLQTARLSELTIRTQHTQDLSFNSNTNNHSGTSSSDLQAQSQSLNLDTIMCKPSLPVSNLPSTIGDRKARRSPDLAIRLLDLD